MRSEKKTRQRRAETPDEGTLINPYAYFGLVHDKELDTVKMFNESKWRRLTTKRQRWYAMKGGRKTTKAPPEEVQIRPQQLVELSCFPPSNVNQSKEQLKTTFRSLSWDSGRPGKTPVVIANHPYGDEDYKTTENVTLIFRILPEKEGGSWIVLAEAFTKIK